MVVCLTGQYLQTILSRETVNVRTHVETTRELMNVVRLDVRTKLIELRPFLQHLLYRSLGIHIFSISPKAFSPSALELNLDEGSLDGFTLINCWVAYYSFLAISDLS